MSLTINEINVSKINGASPAEDRFYVMLLYDISNAKKYRQLVKIVNSYGMRIQKSVFEAYLKREQIRAIVNKVKNLMASEQYYDSNDNVRIYKIAGNCDIMVFGSYQSNIQEENIFL